MTKKESMSILLACKRHGVFMTVRNEWEDHPVVFFGRTGGQMSSGVGPAGFNYKVA